MKRFILILTVLVLLSGFSLFAEAIGGGFSYGLDTGAGGAVFYFSIPQVPFTMVGINASLDGNGGSNHIGITDDYWFYHDHLSGILKLYVGLGFYAGITTGGDQTDFDFGGRVPIGLQAFVIDPLEIFIDVAPTFGFSGGKFPVFGAQGSVGARFWF